METRLAQTRLINDYKVTNFLSSCIGQSSCCKLKWQFDSESTDKGEEFHKICDNISPLLVLVEIEEYGCCFGFYTTKSFNLHSKEETVEDKEAFLFKLKEKNEYKFTKFGRNLSTNNIFIKYKSGIKLGENNLELNFDNPASSFTKGGEDAFALKTEIDLCGKSDNWPKYTVQVYSFGRGIMMCKELISPYPVSFVWPKNMEDPIYSDLKKRVVEYKPKINKKLRVFITGLPNTGIT